MKISLNWLSDYVELDVATNKLVELLDLSGTKVDAVDTPGRSITGVVVAEVVSMRPHPNADNLRMVEVMLDGDRAEEVVCGASNFSPGDRVPLATVGARLPELEVGERKIRGEISRGMLCSGMELGVSKDHTGILVLPPDAPLGEDVVSTLGLDDTILDLGITPNRPDCMSHVGMAREVAALLGKELRLPEVDLKPFDEARSPVQIRVEDERACPRYLARYVDGISVGPAPQWMATRLLACGLRSISNVVDITNYVLLETGHPLHAFDAALVADNTIVVRRAGPGERLTTLDGQQRALVEDDLLIADPHRVLGLAGVMGGVDSEVGEGTSAVILEAAYFDPDTIAFTARRHQLRTEASARFERGADPEVIPFAAARAAQLLADHAGGRVAPQERDVYPRPIERAQVILRCARTNALLGTQVPAEDQAGHLRSIGLEVEAVDDGLVVTVPTRRPDLAREIDLVEEVARLHGLDRLPSTLPSGPAGGLTPNQAAERRLRSILAALGAWEVWTPSLISPRDLDALGLPPEHPARSAVMTANPMTEDESVMRTTLVPSLMKAVARNQAQRVEGIALFEVARVYLRAGSEPLAQESLALAAVFAGKRHPQRWLGAAVEWDFFGAKGIVEAALSSMGMAGLRFSPVKAMPFHPTRAASIALGPDAVGGLGELHPDVCARFDVAPGAVALELALPRLFDAIPGRVEPEELARFPATLIDLAVVVDERIAAGAVQEVIRRAGAPEVVSVRLFDVYGGQQVPEGQKSLAFGLELRLGDRTMTDEEAMAVRDRILPAIEERTGGKLRSW
jgi:phenylalanyl-tRNA synthetase beta chain